MKNWLDRKVEEAKMRIHVAFDYNKSKISELPEDIKNRLNAMRSTTTFMYDAIISKESKSRAYIESALAYVNYCNIVLRFLRKYGGIVV